MDREKIKNYLKRVMELEKNRFELGQILAVLQDKRYAPCVTDISTIKAKESSVPVFLSVIGAIIGFILLSTTYNVILWIVGAVAGWFVGNFIGTSMVKRNISEDKRTRELELEAKNAHAIAEADKKNALILSASKQIQEVLEQTKAELELLYSMNCIYPKYRNFVAIASIYEYLDSGRCTELEGADGAYNLYEMELRLDRIIIGIDMIISKLEEIKRNQYYLYSAIKELTPQIDKISNSIVKNTEKLNEIAVNSEITAYTAKVIERNQYYGRSWDDGRSYSDRYKL